VADSPTMLRQMPSDLSLTLETYLLPALRQGQIRAMGPRRQAQVA
jgi:hypothetical protein